MKTEKGAPTGAGISKDKPAKPTGTQGPQQAPKGNTPPKHQPKTR